MFLRVLNYEAGRFYSINSTKKRRQFSMYSSNSIKSKKITNDNNKDSDITKEYKDTKEHKRNISSSTGTQKNYNDFLFHNNKAIDRKPTFRTISSDNKNKRIYSASQSARSARSKDNKYNNNKILITENNNYKTTIIKAIEMNEIKEIKDTNEIKYKNYRTITEYLDTYIYKAPSKILNLKTKNLLNLNKFNTNIANNINNTINTNFTNNKPISPSKINTLFHNKLIKNDTKKSNSRNYNIMETEIEIDSNNIKANNKSIGCLNTEHYKNNYSSFNNDTDINNNQLVKQSFILSKKGMKSIIN